MRKRVAASSVSWVGRALGRAFLILVLLGLIWLGGLVWFATGIDDPPADPERKTDAIVILTGGSARLEAGLDLLMQGKAKKALISGVHPAVGTRDVLRTAPQVPNWISCCVVLGHAADNTVGNAAETRDWMAKEGFHSLRLVTANYHMRRSLLEFSRVLPPDIEILPNPVFPEAVRHGPWWLSQSSLQVVAVEYLKYLGALLRPHLFPDAAPPPSSP